METALIVFLLLVLWVYLGALGWFITCIRYGYDGPRDLGMLFVCMLFGPVALALAVRNGGP